MDDLVVGFDRALRMMAGVSASSRATPGAGLEDAVSTDAERRHAAGLMRVNHTGEVCAQALYAAQAVLAAEPRIKREFASAAREEEEHLAWTQQRLAELEARPSLLNPLWYAGSFAIGIAAGFAGDRVNLGFVVETERQVEEHLTAHMERLPAGRREEPRHRREDARRRSAPRRGGEGRGRRRSSVSGEGPDARRGGRDAIRRLPRLANGFLSAARRAARTAAATASARSPLPRRRFARDRARDRAGVDTLHHVQRRAKVRGGGEFARRAGRRQRRGLACLQQLREPLRTAQRIRGGEDPEHAGRRQRRRPGRRRDASARRGAPRRGSPAGP